MSMFTTIEDFVKDYTNESEATQRLLDRLTDESLQYSIDPERRTIGQLANHLVPPNSMLAPTGLQLNLPDGQPQQLTSAADIAEAYRRTKESVLEAVAAQWTDESLQEEHEVFGYQWKNGYTLEVFIRHEVHHRGQLTVLMRGAGLPVSGVYGPTKEEWSAFGMEAPA
ncbi:DinB family protein [Paenibacillus sp. GCM10023252]|uniref:DinB family protein n=1 Tax=Paenibacillus sp. GCM10023252 TaxID=3252649 RepID=UPI00360AC371